MKSEGNKIEKTIVEKAKELGASLAGIATVDDLKASPSYEVYEQKAVLRRIRSRIARFPNSRCGMARRAQISAGVGFGPSSIRARSRLVEHEGPGLYPRQRCDEDAVEKAPHLAG